MDQKEFFDELAPTWDDNEVLSTPQKINEILDQLSIKLGDGILDLGTGTGLLLPYLAERIGPSGKLTAVDYSSGMLDRAKSKFHNLIPVPKFLNLNIEEDTIDGDFDLIMLYCVYPHLHKPIETLKWLRAVNLKKEGSIVIAFPCGESFINNIHKEKHSKSDCLLPAHELAKYLTDSGLNANVVLSSKEAYIIKISK